MDAQKKTIGNNELISICGQKRIPAKIDTGANLSSVWASEISITPDKALSFVLFAEGSPFYTGEKIRVTDYTVQRVKSSIGEQQVRYRVTLPISIAGHRIRATFTLADRSKNKFPVLIGRRTIQGKFLVDVSKVAVPHSRPIDTSDLAADLRKDPASFHRRRMNGLDENA